jgi:hypothetical protein
MASPAPLATLLDILQPSLAMYLADSGIWSYPGAEEIKLALADLVADHRSLVERAGERLDARGGVPPATSYPIHFTGCHDVDIGALARRVVTGLRGQIGRLESLIAATRADEAAADSEAHGLAGEARDSSAAHLAALEQVLAVARAREQGRAATPPSAAT